MVGDRLAFLQRAGEEPRPMAGAPILSPDPTMRSAFAVAGLAREHAGERSTVDRDRWVPPSSALLAALHTYPLPFAFTVRRQNGRVDVEFGTWASTPTRAAARSRVLRRLLRGIAPEVDIVDRTPAEHRYAARSGYVLGLPTPVWPEPTDPAAGLDRLIRATGEASWSMTVVAVPLAEHVTSELRSLVLNETREVQIEVQAKSISAPLGELHNELAKALTKSLTAGLAVGTWRTAVYLASEPGDANGYPLLRSAVRGLFNGDRSVPEPVRVIDDDLAAQLAPSWALADVAGPTPPGRVRRYFEYQSLLTSHQLAAFVHLPELETYGFTVRRHVRFDRNTGARAVGDTITIGKVVEAPPQKPGRSVGLGPYLIQVNDLTRHVFVPGVTGAGKTNTIFWLLLETARRGVPFLVLEPAKTEYRSLIDPRLIPGTVVYTVGREDVAPIRLNPFEVIPHTPGFYDVAGHIDRLRSLFIAAFGMWNPLPAVLERSLHRIYADRGWDLRTGQNTRLQDGADPRRTFPTLADLARTVEDVISELGYNREVAENMRGALRVRIRALRIGAKGLMLDTRRSADPATLFTRPTVVELEGLGDEDDKAFLMGLLLIQLAAYRRSLGRRQKLEHLLVIEEAHRLLRNVGSRGGEESNSVFKAVEAFSNLLSEIRAYGQGVIVADQVPTALAPTILKNTNLKIVHRLVAADDREAVGATMAMDAAQVRHLATFGRGCTAVFAEGEDAAVLVELEKVAEHQVDVDDATVRSRAPAVVSECPGDPAAAGKCCPVADELLTSADYRSAFSRAALAASLEGDLSNALADLDHLATAAVPGDLPPHWLGQCVAKRSAAWLADRRGAQFGWGYEKVITYENALSTLIPTVISGQGPSDTVRQAYTTTFRALQMRAFDPFAGCSQVCPDGTCSFRGAVWDALSQPAVAARWPSVEDNVFDDGVAAGRWVAADETGMDLVGLHAGYEVRPYRRSGSVRSALCFAQHAARMDSSLSPLKERGVVRQLIDKYGLSQL